MSSSAIAEEEKILPNDRHYHAKRHLQSRGALGLLLLSLPILCLALRLPLQVPRLESWDEVDFALGLSRYSLSEYRPHFPGYPVYLWLARSLLPWTGDETAALTLVGALLGGLTPLPFFLLVRALFDQKTAWLASLLLIVNPLHWLLSERGFSDVPALFFLMAFLGLACRMLRADARSRRRLFTLGAFTSLGLALGTRPSYFPFLVTAACFQRWTLKTVSSRRERCEQTALAVAALVSTCSLWLFWQTLQLAGESLGAEGARFVQGHFQRWGGTALVESNPLQRAGNLAAALFLHGLGLYGPGSSLWRIPPSLLLVLAAVVYVRHLTERRRGRSESPNAGFAERFLLGATGPYLAWIFLAQNLTRPRHALALVPLALALLAKGIVLLGDFLRAQTRPSRPCLRPIHKGLCRPATLAVVVLLPTFVSSFQLAREQQNEPSPALQALSFIRARYPAGRFLLYGGEESRVLEYYAPDLIVRRAREAREVANEPLLVLAPVESILITSSALKGWQSQTELPDLLRSLSPIGSFRRDPFIDPGDSRLDLYRWTRSAREEKGLSSGR